MYSNIFIYIFIILVSRMCILDICELFFLRELSISSSFHLLLLLKRMRGAASQHVVWLIAQRLYRDFLGPPVKIIMSNYYVWGQQWMDIHSALLYFQRWQYHEHLFSLVFPVDLSLADLHRLLLAALLFQVTGSFKSKGFILWGTWMCPLNLIAI